MFNQKRFYQLGKERLSAAIDEMKAKAADIRVIRDWLPDGRPFVNVTAFGSSAEVVQQAIEDCAVVAGPASGLGQVARPSQVRGRLAAMGHMIHAREVIQSGQYEQLTEEEKLKVLSHVDNALSALGVNLDDLTPTGPTQGMLEMEADQFATAIVGDEDLPTGMVEQLQADAKADYDPERM